MVVRPVAVAAIMLVGCGSSHDNPSDASHAVDSHVASDVASHSDAGACTPSDFTGSATPITIASVTATIEDGSGSAISGMAVSATGIDLSYPGMTGADGSVTVSPAHALEQPIFAFGDGLTYARLGVPLTMATTSSGVLHTAALPVTGSTMTAGSTSTSGGVSIAFAASAQINIDTLDYPDASSQELRVVALSTADEAAVIAGAPQSLVEVFGAAPLGTIVCPPMTVTVPNTAGLAANATVGFYALGLDVSQAWERFGQWQLLGTGTVDATGATITGSLPVLDNFAIAAMQ